MPARIVLKGRGNKYRAKKTPVQGPEGMVMADSKKEAERYLVNQDREAKGEIRDLLFHPKIPLLVNGVLVCHYEADFSYWQEGTFVVEDVKGFRTREYRLKAKLFFALKGYKITEV